jgi:type II secretory pathway pseudopilin PulG
VSALLKNNEKGMTYLFVMMLVIFMSISLMGVTQQWSVIMKRDQEAELLFRGNRIKNAIDLYVADYEVQKATRPNRWPRTLKDLTKKSPKRYLQMAYIDPITGKEFDLIKVGEELHGVKSSSTDTPYNQMDFKGAKTYEAIRFESTGASGNCQLNPLNPTTQANCAPSGTLAPGTLAPGTPAPGTPTPGTPTPGTPTPGVPSPMESPVPSPSEPAPN